MILPQEIFLINEEGEETDNRCNYISILDTLSQLLFDDDIRAFCENVAPLENSHLKFDIRDGELMKDNEIVKRYRNYANIIIFQDAFEVDNPLGSSKSKFKIVGVYMLLANLPPHLRSKTENIKLVMMCLESDVNTFVWDKIFETVVRDIQILETEGLSISVEGKKKLFSVHNL